jgi:hypothetical protein
MVRETIIRGLDNKGTVQGTSNFLVQPLWRSSRQFAIFCGYAGLKSTAVSVNDAFPYRH